MAKYYDLSPDLVYTAAAYHDTGLAFGRDKHELYSGKIVEKDKQKLLKWFDLDEIELIKSAVEDHRCSNEHEPRSVLGKIIAEADRVIDTYRTLTRVLKFGKDNYKGLDKEEQIQRAADYITKKYGKGGRVKIYIPESPNKKKLQDLQRLISKKKELYKKLEEVYDKNK
jgi:uncharacterized protein